MTETEWSAKSQKYLLSGPLQKSVPTLVLDQCIFCFSLPLINLFNYEVMVFVLKNRLLFSDCSSARSPDCPDNSSVIASSRHVTF